MLSHRSLDAALNDATTASPTAVDFYASRAVLITTTTTRDAGETVDFQLHWATEDDADLAARSASAAHASPRPASGRHSLVSLHVTIHPPEASAPSATPLEQRLSALGMNVSFAEQQPTSWQWLRLLLPVRPAQTGDSGGPGSTPWWPDGAVTHLVAEHAMVDRYIYSYRCVLAMFGWRLHDDATGEVDRHRDWRARYAALWPVEGAASGAWPQVAEGYAMLAHIMASLRDVGLELYGRRLARFLLEEFEAGRLCALEEGWRRVWLPLATMTDVVDASTIILESPDGVDAELPDGRVARFSAERRSFEARLARARVRRSRRARGRHSSSSDED